MLKGDWKDAVIASSGTLSAEVDLGRQYDYLAVIIPTIDSAQISIKVAQKTGGTFQDLYQFDGNDDKIFITTAGTGGITVVFPLFGFQFIKILASAAQTGGARTFKVRGVDESY